MNQQSSIPAPRIQLALATLVVAGLFFTGAICRAGLQDVVGLWQLDGDLTNAVAGGDPLDASTFLAAPVFTNATIGGQTATILDLPALAPEERLTVTNPVGGTSGGTFTNDWSLVMDVNLPGPLADFSSLLQTNVDNANDVDVFIRGSNNGIDIGAATVGLGTFVADTWYRLTVTAKADPAAGTITTAAYADGVFLGSTNGNGFDGTMTLEDVFHLFSDNSSETARTLVNSIGYWGEPLAAAEVAALGAATADGIDPTVTVPSLSIVVDRDARAISLQNTSGLNLLTQGYSLTSVNGLLDSDNWLSIADNADADSGGSLDPVNRWIRLTGQGSQTDLSEGVLGTATIPDNTDYDFGAGTWIPHPEEDVVFDYLDENGNLVQGLIEYVGNGGLPFPLGDLDFNNVVDGEDWQLYVAGLGGNYQDLTIAAAYVLGDLTGDRTNNYDDFLAFKAAFDVANGDGAFDRLIGVPEPAAAVLCLVAFSGCWKFFRRRRRLLVLMIGLFIAATTGQRCIAGLSDVAGLWQLDGDLTNAVAGGAPLDASTFTVPPAFTTATIAGETATVLDLPALTSTETLTVINEVGPNAGGVFTNDWTIAMDVLFPSPLAPFSSLIQTNTANSNDVDVFIRGSNNGIDIGAATVGAGTFFADTWYRIVVTGDGDAAAGTVTTAAYADGVFLGSTDGNTFDGTMTLEDVFHLFSDESNETAPTLVNSIGYWGEPLTLQEIAALGPATADGIDPETPVPALKLRVNTTSGAVSMVNEFGETISTNFYEIQSPSGSLSVSGWNSFDDQELDAVGTGPGESWDQGGASSNRLLTEAYLLGFSEFESGESQTLGFAYVANANEGADLSFVYGSPDGFLNEGEVEYFAGISGDFNGDGNYDCLDINALTAAIAGMSTNLDFDMNGDGEITLADVTDPGVGWLAVGGANNPDATGGNAFLVGDANLDGSVDVSDFNRWNGNKFTAVPEWCAGDFNADGSVDVSDFNFWNGNKFTSADHTFAVPEPGTWFIAVVGCALFCFLLPRKSVATAWSLESAKPVTSSCAVEDRAFTFDRVRSFFPLIVCVGCSSLFAATPDRIYLMGEDPDVENGTVGNPVGFLFNERLLTADSIGPSGAFQDLEVVGGPIYADVSDRPAYSGGIGIAFDGVDDYLVAPNLNLPATSAAAFGYDDEPGAPGGPLNYDGIVDRFFQLWVKPDPAGQSATQIVVMDTDEHGLRIVDGKWSLRYASTDVDSAANVDFGQWSHLMVARPFGPEGGGRLYLNGVAIAAEPGGYDGGNTDELVVGSNTARDGDLNFTGGTEQFFHGLLDNLTMSIIGDNTAQGGQDWGGFDFAVENEYVAEIALVGVDPADVNLDGMVAGDGTGDAEMDDVTAFVEGWLVARRVNGVQVGDLISRPRGDLNFDGITDLRDWATLNAANPAMAATVADAIVAIPEPASGFLAAWLLVACLSYARKQ